MLQEEVNALGLPFHLCRLKDIPQKENAAREARYAFLGEIAKEVGAQAVLLGHQMEDQAETVLKRVLEGASLPSCRGMQPVSERDGMVLWRPLLSVSKKELVAWLDGKGISYVQDETNLSPEYLRGRFRTEIFPFLEKAFGKSVMKNLSRLGERAGKLERFLDQLVGPLGDESSILLTRLQGLDEVALDYFLKKWTRSKKINLSLDQLTLLERMVSTGDSQIQVQTATHRFEVVQGKLALKKLYDYLDNKEAVKK
jgi:tRNA(Ile)-lysidine synthase